MNRWPRASPCPVGEESGRCWSSEPRSMATAACFIRARQIGAGDASVPHCRGWWPRRSAAARQSRNSPTSSQATFVPAVMLVSLLATFIVWTLFGPEPRMAHGLVNAVAVLIIACPCALGLATPMSILVCEQARGPPSGVLFKNAEAIEILRKVDTLVIDKTGTLTEGQADPSWPSSTCYGTRRAGGTAAGREPRALERTPPGRRNREGACGSKHRAIRRSRRIRNGCRQGGDRTVGGRAVVLGNSRPGRAGSGIDRSAHGPGRRPSRGGPDGHLRRSTARRSGCWASRMPSRRARPARSVRCMTKASASSCSRATAGLRRTPSRASSASTR